MKKVRGYLNSIIIWAITGVLVCLTGLLIFFFISYSKTLRETEQKESYDKYYAMISTDSKSSFWQSLYKSTFEAGKEKNAYVDMISENLSKEYSETELMEIAIASGVDGIIVEANESEEMTEAIHKAYEMGIPVVTLNTDNRKSERISFVGISNYELGSEYGKLVLSMATSKPFPDESIKVVVLVDANADDLGQNILFSAMQETIENASKVIVKPIEMSMFLVDESSNFSVEESVRNMFIENRNDLPDIVVCLNEIDTTSVYQTVVEYNDVGLVNILGYYDSEAIIKGIERNVIYATISIDANQMGEYCIDALSEYWEFGNTSQYFVADVSVINSSNVSTYREEEENEDKTP